MAEEPPRQAGPGPGPDAPAGPATGPTLTVPAQASPRPAPLHRPALGRRTAGDRLAVFRHGLRCYGLIAAMWVRSVLTYRTSFLMMTFGTAVASFLDFVAIMLMFSHVDVLGGYPLAAVALLYGTSSASLGVADLLLGNLERVGRRIRDGTMDTLLVRPVPVFAQMAADRFAPYRIGRLLSALLVLGWALPRVEGVRWGPVEVVLLPVAVLAGGAIFGALFALGGAFQFWAQDAAEVQNSFTYGGSTMVQYPPTVFAQELVRGAVYVLPLAFVNWLPMAYLLGQELPLGLPAWLAFLSPVVALVWVTVAGLAWRAGLRSYRSTGS